jgi:hypothetical protein
MKKRTDDFYTTERRIKPRNGPYPLKWANRGSAPVYRDAWFYTNKGSIDVCIYQPGVGTDTVRIPLRKLRQIVRALS